MEDFDPDELLKNRIGKPIQSKPTNSMLAKELAKINNSVHRLDGLIIRRATT
jgi:hypothetical protein